MAVILDAPKAQFIVVTIHTEYEQTVAQETTNES
jgi:hypothetical protein